jgi:hypothetical protein
VLRAIGETETTEENIHDWLRLDAGNPGFQLLTEDEAAILLNFHFIGILNFFKDVFCFIHPDYLLIPMTPSGGLARVYCTSHLALFYI